MKLLVKVAAGTIFLIIFTMIVAFVGGRWFMLSVGVAHGEWTGRIPAMGYWTAVKITTMLSLGAGLHQLRIHYSKQQ